jgi:non-heme chloroperoxidase
MHSFTRRAASRAAASATLLALAALAALAALPLAPARAQSALTPGPSPGGGTPSLRFGEVRLPTGVRLHYAEQGDAAGQVVILLHGYSDSWFSFSRILPLLPAGYRVYALDQRGHGDSEQPAGGYAPRDLAADVVAFMEAKGIERATVVGHSMGSLVAQQVALAAPQRVQRLVLLGTMTTVRNMPGIGELALAIDSLSDPVPEAFAREFQASTVHQPVPPEFMDRMVAGSLRLPARAWRALMAGMLATDAPVALGAHRIPTLILWGDRDAYCTRAEQDALVRMLGTATLKVYTETGHTPHWERPHDVARDLVAFLGGG